MSYQLHRILYLFLLLICLEYTARAQTNTQDTVADSKGFVAKMQDFAKRSAISSAADLAADKAEQIQEATLVEIKKNLQKAKLYLRTGLDTSAAKNELALIAEHTKLVGHGVFTHKDIGQTYRNLVTTEKILKVNTKPI